VEGLRVVARGEFDDLFLSHKMVAVLECLSDLIVLEKALIDWYRHMDSLRSFGAPWSMALSLWSGRAGQRMPGSCLVGRQYAYNAWR